jgi:hypothetical protein
MRIQPHVWSRPEGDTKFLLSVLRDSIITHGHPHGFCGAVFHALALADILAKGSIPSPAVWTGYLHTLKELPQLIREDRQLFAFWLPAWTEKCGAPLETALSAFIEEAGGDIRAVQSLAGEGPPAYKRILNEIGCFEDRYRGSGWKTSLAATALAWLYRDHPVEEALIAAANALGSDTDTIATMAGALLGATAREAPTWHIQDAAYISSEARRLAAIGRGELTDSFSYPDPAKWIPPVSQSDAIVLHGGGLAVAGLGPAEPCGDENSAGGYIWQWLRLAFGQTILAKRRKGLNTRARQTQLPGERRESPARAEGRVDLELPLDVGSSQGSRVPTSASTAHSAARPIAVTPRESPERVTLQSPAVNSSRHRAPLESGSIDTWTSHVIHSNFDDLVLGKMLNLCIDELGTIEGAAAFAGILAKAKLARRRKYG